MATPGCTLVFTYPDENPFEEDPPIPNLIPSKPELQQISPATAAQHVEQARQTALNPLRSLYGQNPLSVSDLKLRVGSLPLGHYIPPPPLPQIQVNNIEFIRRLNPKGRTPVYKVRVGEEIRILKLFTDRDPDEEWDPKESGWPMLRFRREKEAYAHLLRSGVCKKGIVPYCYGWFVLSRADVERCYALPLEEGDPQNEDKRIDMVQIREDGPDSPFRSHTLLDDRRPPKAILFQYFPEAVQLTISNITPAISETAVKNLYQIHAAYVRHGDIHRRNVLLLPGGRVVWIDFDESTCPPETNWKRKLTRQKLLDELATAWSLFYQSLLPDQYIGFQSWLC